MPGTPDVMAPCIPRSLTAGESEQSRDSTRADRQSTIVAACYRDASVDRNARRGSQFQPKRIGSDPGHRPEARLCAQLSPASGAGCSTVASPPLMTFSGPRLGLWNL